jgi:HK97 family phage portal protein
MPWPFKRKTSLSFSLKSASFLIGMGGLRAGLTNAAFQQLASEGYSENAVVYACVTKIANAAASVEPKLYQKAKGGKLKQIDTHPLLQLIDNPNPAESSKEFIRHLISDFLIGGNTYIFGNGIDPNRKSKPPTELQILNPGKIKVVEGAGLFPTQFEYKPNGNQTFTYPVDQITGLSPLLQIKTYNPISPWYGMAPMIAAALGIDIHNGGQKWNKRLLDNEARPSGALTVKDSEGKPATLSEDQYNRVKEMIDEHYSGKSNAGRPMLLEGGLEWQQLSMTAKDMDFLEGKNSAARDIGLVFGVPPQILGIKGDSTFANYEQANLSFWSDTVIPLIGLIYDSLNRWLTPLYGEDLFLWYDEDAIPALEARRKEKADRINASKVMTIDEKREAMGLEALPNKIGEAIMIDGRGVLLGMDGQIISYEGGTPTPGAPTTPDSAKHREWLESIGYTKERAERLTKLTYSA